MTKISAQETSHQVLYRHVKRSQWGLAVLAWEHADRRGFQFEDGQLRVFKRGFYTLLQEVDLPADQTRQALHQLGRSMDRQEAVKGAQGKMLVPISEQIAYFKEQFPDGFSGEAWTTRMRGQGARTMLKRHRDPVILLAVEQLAPARLEGLIDAGQYDKVLDALMDVLARTNLVTASKLKPLHCRTPGQREAAARALLRLVKAEGDRAVAVGQWVLSLGGCSWELATAPLALVDPSRHLCVRPGVFQQQALWMMPRLQHTRHPAAETYERYRRMAGAVSLKLEEAGLPPQDLMDVHDFIYLTLRPAILKLLSERSRERNARTAAPHQGGAEPKDPEQQAA